MIHGVVDTVQTRDKKKKEKKTKHAVGLPEKSADGSCDKSRKAVETGGGYDLVCADVPLYPPPPPPPSELMRGFLMLFLASWSWRAMRGCRREREEKAEEEEEEQQGDEEARRRK